MRWPSRKSHPHLLIESMDDERIRNLFIRSFLEFGKKPKRRFGLELSQLTPRPDEVGEVHESAESSVEASLGISALTLNFHFTSAMNLLTVEIFE